MRLTRIGWCLALLALGACTATISPAESSRPSAAPSAPSTAPEISIQVLGAEPVLEGAAVDDDWVLPGALAFDDGTYHLWGMAFDQETEEHHGFYATSPDGETWAVDVTDPLITLDWDLSRPGAVPTSVVRADDGTWVMYAWGVPAPSERGGQVWRATAPSAGGPWTGDPEPVLEGTAGTWDGGGLDFPSVIRTGDGYLMVYTGVSVTAFNSGHLGVATSPDGATWTKVPDPVIAPGHCGDFDGRSITQPRLMETDAGYLVAYSGQAEGRDEASIGVSTSVDGVAWTCASSVPALTTSDIPESQGIHTLALANGAAGPEVLVESIGEASSALWLADLE